MIVRSGTLADLGNPIKQGFNAGAWNGAGGIISSSAAASALHKTALGYATASSIGSVFDGQNVSGSNLLVRYVYAGDANLDGMVDTIDFNLLATSFSQSGKS